jgi:large-conductance mechanosensitive channel
VIRQILLTLVVALVVFLVVQARRRSSRVAREDHSTDPRFTPQAIAGWVLLAVMIGAAIGVAFLHNGSL